MNIQSVPANAGQEIYHLAGKCRVAVLAACRRIGMNSSTPYRWREGTHAPTRAAYDRLRSAIIVSAHEANSLPPDLLPDLPEAMATIGVREVDQQPAAILQQIEDDVRRLKRAIGAQAAAS